MNAIDTALSDLKTQLFHFSFPALTELELRRSVVKLARLVDQVSAQPPRFGSKTGLSPEDVWRKWEMQSYAPDSLSPREWRTLCGSPLTALRPQLIRALEEHPEPLTRLANFIGVAFAYFRDWRPEGSHLASASSVEKLLLQQLQGTYRQSKNRVVREWKNYPQVFSPRASHWIADVSLKDRVSIKDAAKSLYIDAATGLVSKSLEIAASKATATLIKSTATRSEDATVNELVWLREHLFVRDLDADVYRKCLGDLIVSPLPDKYPVCRQLLTQLVTEDVRLGDPRLPESGANWRRLLDKPRETFLSWLAQQYIQLFFDIVVPKSDENRRRAEFWLRYAKKGQIKDFQVAVSSDDLYKVQSSRDARALSYARVSAATNTSSAFIMEFHGHGERYVIVEFSETGRAACIYTKTMFESNGAHLRRRSFNMSELHDTTRRSDRITHPPGWEPGAVVKLRSMGITF